MLKGIPSILSPEFMKILMEMDMGTKLFLQTGISPDTSKCPKACKI